MATQCMSGTYCHNSQLSGQSGWRGGVRLVLRQRVRGVAARGIDPWELHRYREIHGAHAQDGHAQHRAREDFVER